MMIPVAQAPMIIRQSSIVNRFVGTQDDGVKDFELKFFGYTIRKKTPAQICTCIRRDRNVFLVDGRPGP